MEKTQTQIGQQTVEDNHSQQYGKVVPNIDVIHSHALQLRLTCAPQSTDYGLAINPKTQGRREGTKSLPVGIGQTIDGGTLSESLQVNTKPEHKFAQLFFVSQEKKHP